MTSQRKSLKVFFYTLDAVGHINACAGLAQGFAERGHKVTFLINSAFRDRYVECTNFGFDEILLHRANKPGTAGTPSPPEADNDEEAKAARTRERAKRILELGVLSTKSPLEKLKDAVSDDSYVKGLYETAVDFNPQIAEAIEREKPDLFILDHFVRPPAMLQARIPWFYLSSSSPLGVLDSPKLPPATSGYSVTSDPALWEEFRQYNGKFDEYFIKYQKKLYEDFNYAYTEDELVAPRPNTHHTKSGIIYGYPRELDYQDVIPIDDNDYIRVDAFCRKTTEQFELPDQFVHRKPNQKLIYLSLGSVGSVDLELMRKITNALAKTEHKVVVSKGMLAKDYDLPENCWGEEYLPQTQVLPLVDLVITHGGNNSVTETFLHGKPMIVMPLFADQPDNAQRIHQKGFGIKLNPYAFEESDLLDAVNHLLNDAELNQKLKRIAQRIESDNFKQKAIEKIEQLVAEFKK